MHTLITQELRSIRVRDLPRVKSRRLGRGIFGALRKNRDGTTAIEFAILGVPFMALLFGIVEISVLFFVTSTTHHAVAEVSRQIRTGEFQSTGGGAEEFKDAICAAMSGVGSCDNLRVDVLSSATGQFSDLNLPTSPVSCSGTSEEIEACEAADPEMLADEYTDTSGGDVVIVRVQYVHQLAVPNELTRLSNAAGNTHIITATTAFKNEPF
ncbi:MAG: pilus assembly protein [Robiginitomaculum sp.]|nr:pilus assembly protein [Robiginitomaculum sp.]